MFVQKAFRVLFSLILISSSSLLFADDSLEYIATVRTAHGDVSIQRDSAKEPLLTGNGLIEGDIVTTSRSGNVSLLFVDGTQLSLGPSTSIIINRYLFTPKKKEYAFELKLNKGSAIYSSGKMSKLAPESVKIQTPQATIGVRGTKFLVEVD